MTENIRQWIKAYAVSLFYTGAFFGTIAALIWTPLLTYLVWIAIIGGTGLFIASYASGLKRKMVERIEDSHYDRKAR